MNEPQKPGITEQMVGRQSFAERRIGEHHIDRLGEDMSHLRELTRQTGLHQSCALATANTVEKRLQPTKNLVRGVDKGHLGSAPAERLKADGAAARP